MCHFIYLLSFHWFFNISNPYTLDATIVYYNSLHIFCPCIYYLTLLSLLVIKVKLFSFWNNTLIEIPDSTLFPKSPNTIPTSTIINNSHISRSYCYTTKHSCQTLILCQKHTSSSSSPTPTLSCFFFFISSLSLPGEIFTTHSSLALNLTFRCISCFFNVAMFLFDNGLFYWVLKCNIVLSLLIKI